MSESLRQAILAFELDDPASDLKFTERLARENGWSLEFAKRAIVEYKRFLILCVEAGRPMTPSDEVDQVWHLHLCYTRSYWNDLCRDVLKQPLHHGPTKGGKSENDKFHDWYRNTLEAYRQAFAENPPSDIWPNAEIRFGRQNFKRVDLHSHFMFSKRKALIGSLGVGAAASLTGCASVIASGDGVPWFFIIIGVIILVAIIKAIKNGGGAGGSGACGWFGGCGGDSGCGGGSGCIGGCGGD